MSAGLLSLARLKNLQIVRQGRKTNLLPQFVYVIRILNRVRLKFSVDRSDLTSVTLFVPFEYEDAVYKHRDVGRSRLAVRCGSLEQWEKLFLKFQPGMLQNQKGTDRAISPSITNARPAEFT